MEWLQSQKIFKKKTTGSVKGKILLYQRYFVNQICTQYTFSKFYNTF